jgi:hypothetical protein
MASYSDELDLFVQEYGEEAVAAALRNYVNQRERSKQAAAKAQSQRQGLQTLIGKAKSNPQIAELLKQAGISVGV